MFAIPNGTDTAESASYFGKMIDFMTGLFTAETTDAFTRAEARAGTVGLVALTMVGTSIYTRKRAAANEEPFLKVLF